MKRINKVDIYALLGVICTLLAIFTPTYEIKITLNLSTIFLILGGVFAILLGKEVGKY